MVRKTTIVQFRIAVVVLVLVLFGMTVLSEPADPMINIIPHSAAYYLFSADDVMEEWEEDWDENSQEQIDNDDEEIEEAIGDPVADDQDYGEYA